MFKVVIANVVNISTVRCQARQPVVRIFEVHNRRVHVARSRASHRPSGLRIARWQLLLSWPTAGSCGIWPTHWAHLEPNRLSEESKCRAPHEVAQLLIDFAQTAARITHAPNSVWVLFGMYSGLDIIVKPHWNIIPRLIHVASTKCGA